MKQNPNLKIVNPSRRSLSPQRPALRFTPTAWAKLLFLRDLGPTEVGGFGLADEHELLLVTDLQLVKQDCSPITVAFDDLAVAEFFDEQVDQGLRPAQFARIWIHTHPGDSAQPSNTDEETFARAFGQTDWAVMFILAQKGQTYCRLQYHRQPACALELAVEVDYRQPFAATDHSGWETEYREKVNETVLASLTKRFDGINNKFDCECMARERALVPMNGHWDEDLFMELEGYRYDRNDY
jgi:proteasome lid subunit RPN8/RPN11